MSDSRSGLLDLMLGVHTRRYSRRQVLERGLALGLSTPVIMGLLAACGGDDDDDDDESSSDTTEEQSASTETEAESEATETTEESDEAGTAAGTEGDTGTGEARNESDNRVFTTTLPGGAPDLDPHSAYDERASMVFFGTYEMLLRLKDESTFEYEPMLAKEWEANDDLTEFTFRIDEGITFHDGSICDAQAIKDSFVRFHSMGLGPVDVFARFVDDPEAQIEVVDPTTIVFTMNQPEPLFLAAMASQYGPFVVSSQAVEENKTDDDPWAHEWLVLNMVGTGPYTPTEIKPNEQFVLDRYDDYHGAEHFFDRIIIRVVDEPQVRRQLLEGGEADGDVQPAITDREDLKNNPDLQVVDYDSTSCSWELLNYALLNKEVRQALCYAYPYQTIIDDIYQGYGKIQGPIPDTVVGYDPDIPLYSQDLDKAKELLDSGGFDYSQEIEYLYQTGDDIASAQLFQSSLAEIGVTLKLREIDPSGMNSLLFGDQPAEERPHIISWGWWPDYNDSYNQLYPNFHSESFGSAGSNALGYSNADVDELLDQAANAATQEELTELTSQIVQILMWDDPAAIFYVQNIRSTALSADIRGFVPNGIYIATYNFHKMWREAV